MWRPDPRHSRSSFYTSALVVLYVNFVMNFYEVLFFSPQYENLFRRKYLGKEMALDENNSSLNYIFFPILQIFVFMVAIIFVSKKKTTMVTFAIVILFLDMISTVLSSIWNCYKYYAKCESSEFGMSTNEMPSLCGNNILRPNNGSMMEFKTKLDGTFSPGIVLIVLTSASFLSVVFKFGCIMILQGYKMSLKATRMQRGIDIRDSCDVDQDIPCYSYVVRSDPPPQYAASATVNL